MPLHIFVPGESALVAENLDANFQYLLSLIQGGGTQMVASATGTSTAQASAAPQFVSIALANGQSTAFAFSTMSAQTSATATATGTATDHVVSTSQAGSVGAATGSSSAASFSTTPSVATATGTSSTSYIGSGSPNALAVATGTSAASATSNKTIAGVASAQGNSTATATGSGGATESADGTTVTQPGQNIFASATPGSASGTLNTFALTANPGVVILNGSNDATTSNVVEIYYTGHVLYRQNQDGSWFRWASAGTWTPTTNPLPVFIAESVEGATVTTAQQTIFSSATPGQAAPAGSTVAGGGLQTWTLTANPGLVVHSGTSDATTTNTVQIYYHNHSVWRQNSGASWFSWSGSAWVTQATGPVPNAPTINVATIAPQINTNSTFVVNGTYQDFAGPGNPTLQYADNATIGSPTTSWNPNDKSASITLTNTNLTASSTAAAIGASVRSTTNYASGKHIFEVTASTVTGNWECGVANGAAVLTNGLGDDNNGIGFQPNWPGGSQAVVFNGAVVSNGTNNNSANGEAVTICVDFGATLFWATSAAMRATSGANAWNNNGSANPATGTGGLSFAGPAGPWFIIFNEFDSGGGAAMNTLGPFAVAIPSGFTAWDVSSGSTTWLALPSNVAVTPTQWSFVHPPVSTQNPSATVSVRDQATTGIIGRSNTFQIQVPGVVTLNPMTLDNTTFAAGQPTGTLVGNLSIPASGGTFTGNVTSNNANFTVSGSGGVRQVVTAAVLAAQSYAVTFTATMVGATNSGETLATTLVGQAESPSATAITTVGPTINGSATPGVSGSALSWGLIVASGSGKTGNQITLNGVRQTTSNAVTELYYINHTLYQSTGTAPVQWSFYNGTGIVGGQYGAGSFTSCPTPIPNIVLSTLTFPPNFSGQTPISASLMSAGNALPNVTWTEDSPSFTFVGNVISTTGALPTGNYPINITATIA